MTEQPFGDLGNPQLEQIHEGMEVYDPQENKIGTVERVYFGSASEEVLDRGGGPMTAPDPTPRESDSLIDNLAEAIAGADDIPETLANRLRRHGFIRIDPGMLQSDLYAMPDQIARVDGERVVLSVPKDKLLER